MRKVIDPGNKRRSINFIDNICYSEVTDLQGNPLKLYLSLMVQNGNSEMRLASGKEADDEADTIKQPLIVWINGAGWRGCDKNLMTAEMQFLAEAGFAVAFIYYRSSAEGHFPTQLIDCKTAVRFLRAHADEYGIDPEHVGVIGRSAGGHLTAWMAMNLDGYDTEEWAGYSSNVSAAVDMFGPTWFEPMTKKNMEMVKVPGFRWSKMSETHEGALMGVTDDMTDEEILKMAHNASPISFISDTMCPIMILHGDQDPLVPLLISETFYEALIEAGYENQADLYILKNGGHGTREFFQLSTKKLIAEYFTEHLKQEGK